MNRIILTKTVKNNNTYTVYALMDAPSREGYDNKQYIRGKGK